MTETDFDDPMRKTLTAPADPILRCKRLSTRVDGARDLSSNFTFLFSRCGCWSLLVDSMAWVRWRTWWC